MMRKLHGGGGRDRKGRARAELRYADDEASGQGELHFPSSSLLLDQLPASVGDDEKKTKGAMAWVWTLLFLLSLVGSSDQGKVAFFSPLSSQQVHCSFRW